MLLTHRASAFRSADGRDLPRRAAELREIVRWLCAFTEMVEADNQSAYEVAADLAVIVKECDQIIMQPSAAEVDAEAPVETFWAAVAPDRRGHDAIRSTSEPVDASAAPALWTGPIEIDGATHLSSKVVPYAVLVIDPIDLEVAAEKKLCVDGAAAATWIVEMTAAKARKTFERIFLAKLADVFDATLDASIVLAFNDEASGRFRGGGSLGLRYSSEDVASAKDTAIRDLLSNAEREQFATKAEAVARIFRPAERPQIVDDSAYALAYLYEKEQGRTRPEALTRVAMQTSVGVASVDKYAKRGRAQLSELMCRIANTGARRRSSLTRLSVVRQFVDEHRWRSLDAADSEEVWRIARLIGEMDHNPADVYRAMAAARLQKKG